MPGITSGDSGKKTMKILKNEGKNFRNTFENILNVFLT